MRNILYISLLFLLLAALPAQAAERNMGDHAMTPSDRMEAGQMMAHDQVAYSDRAYLSGMIAHHEGAVQMSEALLAAPKKQQDPQVAAWAGQIIKAQKGEIAQMKAWLKDVGGLDQHAYDAMRHEMQNMMHMYTSSNPNVQFVQQMLPHHGMAVTMTVPVLVHSQKADLLKLGQEIIEAQAAEMHAFRIWLNARGDHNI